MSGSAPARILTRRELLDFSLGAVSGSDHWIRVHRQVMACRFEVALSGQHASYVAGARQALDEAERVENVLTVFRDESEISRVNARAGREDVSVTSELFSLLERCARLHLATGGAFDATATPLSRTWGFLRREGRLPAPSEINAARSAIGMEHVELRAETRAVRFRRRGMELSFGSFGKGYALDRMARALRGLGLPGALVSAGGSSIVALGGGRQGFVVDVRSLRSQRERLFRLRLRDAAQSTSGSGEQFFEVDGKRYGHVIDPRTGWPAEGVLSATAMTDDAADADALSTAFLVAGPGFAERYCSENARTVALLVMESEPDRVLLFGNHPHLELEV